MPTAGQVWLPRGGQTGAMIRIESGNVTVSGITLIGHATTTSHNHVSGIYVTHATGTVTLRDLTIENMHHRAPDGIMDPMGGFGIDVRHSNDVRIINNTITRFNNQGIRQTGGNTFIQDNVIIGMNDNNQWRAKSGIQIGPASVTANLIGNRIENLRFDGTAASAIGISVFDGVVTADKNIFEYMDVGINASGGWGDPSITMRETVYNDDSARDTDIFVRVEGGGGASGVHASVVNRAPLWANRISFPFGGGRYNHTLVTTPGTAAYQKLSGTLPNINESPGAAVVTFHYPEYFTPSAPAGGMFQLRLPYIIGNRVSNSLTVWTAEDGNIQGSHFPMPVPVNYIIEGWRCYGSGGNHGGICIRYENICTCPEDAPYVMLADSLPVIQPATIVPVLRRFEYHHTVTPSPTATPAPSLPPVYATPAPVPSLPPAPVTPQPPIPPRPPISKPIPSHVQGPTQSNSTPSRPPSARPSANPLTDIPPAQAHEPAPAPPIVYPEIHHAFIVGYDDGYVRPLGNTTRAHAATIFFRLMSDSARTRLWTQDNPFFDVKLHNWFNNAISTTTNANIFNGMPDGSFQPNRPITRAEFAAAVVQFMGVNPDDSPPLFNDINGHWAQGHINAAANYNWVTGYEGIGGRFLPEQPITRAETAALINRMLLRLPETADDLLQDMITWPDNNNRQAWYYLYIQEATNTHYFVRKPNGVHETWTELLPPRSWIRLERPDSRPEDIFRE